MCADPAVLESSAPRPGSAGHSRLLAQFFLDTHIEYVPENIDWPVLSETELTRLTGLPFWQEAVSTENITSSTVVAAAEIEPDTQVRAAIALQGFEEQRHARLLSALTSHYGIAVEQPPPFTPHSLEDDFLFAGFGECFDSFFAFGLFEIARRSGYFPPRLIEIFDPIMQEEARHILFFVNWLADRRARLAPWRRPFDRLRLGLILGLQVRSRVKTAVGMGRSQENFTLRGHQAINLAVTPTGFLSLCLEQNERRFSPYDPRLRRPKLLPGLAKFLLFWLPKGGVLTPAG